MKYSELKIYNFQYLFCILLFAFCLTNINAQSTNIAFPTAVSTSEINGTIPARDIGDARLTSFYYTFNGAQGDIFINISTSNFNGDIDLYAAEGLRPLSKISMYADSASRETGRVIYLRKPEKLILRVQGRTPDDNPAHFTIKFAGSFVAVQDSGEIEQPKLPEITPQDSSGIRVNSVGTIIEVLPKPTPVPVETIAETEKKEVIEETPVNSDEKESEIADKDNEESTDSEATVTKKPAPRNSRRTAARRSGSGKGVNTPLKTETPKETPPNPLENVHLKVFMKTGEEIDFPMTEVFRFSMNNGILTVTMKSGKIHRYPILDTQRIVIE